MTTVQMMRQPPNVTCGQGRGRSEALVGEDCVYLGGGGSHGG